MDRAYVDRFTAEELDPRRAENAMPSPAADEWRDIFAGSGPLVERPVPQQPPPAAARRHLQVLGRPAPATAEVRKRSSSSSGDARTLFPDLYGAPAEPGEPDVDPS